MLKTVEVAGFKSFGRKVELHFGASIAAIVGPNGSGKSNVAEALRFVLGEQSMKSLRSKKGEDLIWGGSGTLPRGNRAGVKVVFDNRADRSGRRRLDLDFDEVAIERVVYRDGQNEYLLNGSQVRLRDVIQLLAGANIGGSGYQIISQGEADRILNSSPRERREMVEDALGLKLYQHKKAESERRLEETRQNIEKVESLRRELAPHLKFLKKQVEKIEKTRELKDELSAKLADYLAREHAWLNAEKAQVKDDEAALKEQQAIILQTKASADQKRETPATAGTTMAPLEDAVREARNAREEAMRTLGRAEGALSVAARQNSSNGPRAIRADVAARFVDDVAAIIARADVAQTVDELRAALDEVRALVHTLQHDMQGTAAIDTSDLERDVADAAAVLEKTQSLEVEAQRALEAARSERERAREGVHEAERASLVMESKLREVEGRLREVARRREQVAMYAQQFEEEVREGIILIGEKVHAWEDGTVPEGALVEPRSEQEMRRRSIERLKIKIEEYGAGNTADVEKEFTQTVERDAFLTRELDDLSRSEVSLRAVIEELDATMDQRFTEGLSHINEALQSFFARLFNGGEAKLVLEKPQKKDVLDDDAAELDAPAVEEKAPIQGLTVSVQLPRKKVRGLEVLSGGERALTSIALIFAMSQVNPPPFLILDETDAALDEANSKRYADMLTLLSERSQLIVITHNRATMASAGELYGVTMGHDGVSKLLSVKLAEAEQVAK